MLRFSEFDRSGKETVRASETPHVIISVLFLESVLLGHCASRLQDSRCVSEIPRLMGRASLEIVRPEDAVMMQVEIDNGDGDTNVHENRADPLVRSAR